MSDFDSNNNNLMPDGTRVRQQTMNPYSVTNKSMGALVQGSLTSIIDALGLNSLHNFPSGNIVDNTARTTASNSYADISGTSLTFTLIRQARVFIITTYVCQLTNMGSLADAQGVVQLNIDGTNDGFPLTFDDVQLYTSGFSSNVSRTASFSYQKIATLVAGSHTIKLQYLVSGAHSETFKIIASSVSYIVLGN